MSHLNLSLASILAYHINSQLLFTIVFLLWGFLLAQWIHRALHQFVFSFLAFFMVLACQQVDGGVLQKLALDYL